MLSEQRPKLPARGGYRGKRRRGLPWLQTSRRSRNKLINPSKERCRLCTWAKRTRNFLKEKRAGGYYHDSLYALLSPGVLWIFFSHPVYNGWGSGEIRRGRLGVTDDRVILPPLAHHIMVFFCSFSLYDSFLASHHLCFVNGS